MPRTSHAHVAGLPLVNPNLTAKDRAAIGRAARKNAPRKGQSNPGNPDRPSPLRDIQTQDTSRISPLIPLRHSRMSASPFTFFRGTAALQAADLATTPNSGLTVQLCGDAHLANFGLFAARDRKPVFDLNDFDETHPGPFEWDLKRFCASVYLAARDIGANRSAARTTVQDAAAYYRQSMARFAGLPDLDIWYYRIDQDRLSAGAAQEPGNLQRAITRGMTAAQKRTGWTAVSKLTYVDGKQRRFRTIDPILTPMPAGHRDLAEHLYALYINSLNPDRQMLLSRYRIVDVAFKVVGVGSVGLYAVAALLQGRDENDLLALQLKEAQTSVLENHTQPSVFPNHGQRVVVGQTLIQAAGDQFLGWLTGLHGREHYARQLRDMKWSPQLETLQLPVLQAYSHACAHALARAHARTGDPIAISAYLGNSTTFDTAMADYAAAYTNYVDTDYTIFLNWQRETMPNREETSLADWWEKVLELPRHITP